jgi:hypothetical protein
MGLIFKDKNVVKRYFKGNEIIKSLHKGDIIYSSGAVSTLFASYPLANNSIESLGITSGINGSDTNISYNGSEADFNGTSSSIIIPDNNVFSFTDGVNDKPFSIEFDINFMFSLSGFPRIIGKYETGKAEWRCFLFSGTGIGVQLATPNGSNRLQIIYPITPALGQYYNVKVTYDGSKLDTGLNMFVDDVSGGSRATTGTYTGMVNGTSVVTIGKASTGGANTFNGNLKNLKFNN